MSLTLLFSSFYIVLVPLFLSLLSPRVTAAVTQGYMAKSHLGKKGCLWLTYVESRSRREAKVGTQNEEMGVTWRQELTQRPEKSYLL